MTVPTAELAEAFGSPAGLARTWGLGWAGCREYPVISDGDDLVVSVGRPGRMLERVCPDPFAERIDAALTWVAGNADRWVTILPHTDSQLVLTDGAHLYSSDETLMWRVLAPDDDVRAPDRTPAGDSWIGVEFDDDGRTVARGYAGLVGSILVFDRILTASSHRRRGLGTQVMSALTATGMARGCTHGALVASLEGQALYSRLGWTEAGGVLVIGGSPDAERPAGVPNPGL